MLQPVGAVLTQRPISGPCRWAAVLLQVENGNECCGNAHEREKPECENLPHRNVEPGFLLVEGDGFHLELDDGAKDFVPSVDSEDEGARGEGVDERVDAAEGVVEACV